MSTSRAYPTSISALFENACRWRGDRVFFSDETMRLSGREALDASRRVAQALQGAGVGRGSAVAFMTAASVRHAITFFAVQHLGGVCCALHTRETNARLAAAVNALDCRVLVADESHAEAATVVARHAACPVDVLVLDGDGYARLLQSEPFSALADLAEGDPAVVLLSSGSTGSPKLVLHTQASVRATALSGHLIYAASSPADAILLPMAPSYAAWLHCVMPFVALRARIVFRASFDPDGYRAALCDEQITVAPLVPTAWRLLLRDLDSRPVETLRVAMFSGEAGSIELLSGLGRIAPIVRSAYLASEGGCAAGIMADETLLAQPGLAAAAGYPVLGADVLICDPDEADLHPLARGEAGEILIRGASLAAGYIGDETLTRLRFRDGWWRSGDLGVVDDSGILHVRGRTDNRINSGGIKVHAEEIEAALASHPAVTAVAVVGEPDERWGECIVGHVVANRPVEAEDLLTFCEVQGLLPRTHLPKVIYFRDALPTGPTGKLYRKALLQLQPHRMGSSKREETNASPD